MRTLLAVLALLLSACAPNPYTKFYRGTPDARKVPSYVPVQGDIQIYSTNDFDRDIHALIRRSYFVVGQSSFNAPGSSVTDGQLREQARKVGAQTVLVSSSYTNTESGAMPLTLPQTSTSYTTANATAYGPAGVVNAYGRGTTTTYGSQTVMMPYSVARSDFAAVFLAKFYARVGMEVAPLDVETRKRLQTNGGLRVIELMEDTPAFNADVLAGDVLLAIGTERVQSYEQFGQLLNQYQGRTMTFKFDRNGTAIDKELEIRPYPTVVR